MENKDAVNMVDKQVDQGSTDSFSTKLMQLVRDHFGRDGDPVKIVELMISAMGWDTEEMERTINVILMSQREVNAQIERKFRNAELISELIKKLDTAAEIMSCNVSDGRETFGDLYHHRAVLFMTICKQFPDKAWMSCKHYDGSMYESMFVVGVDTPKGPATYHFNANPYWRLFKGIVVRELEYAPKWDGHDLNATLDRIACLYSIKDIRGYTIGVDVARGASAPICHFDPAEAEMAQSMINAHEESSTGYDFANGCMSAHKEDK